MPASLKVASDHVDGGNLTTDVGSKFDISQGLYGNLRLPKVRLGLGLPVASESCQNTVTRDATVTE